ncbi:indole-3-glycerol phosphate synthase TrpC [Candidatus Woesearchaeota archaeon]|nr:indole-3-glycerol phosphate synthase TrpC [Candidatus Woesearchaeota archaeon]
MILQKIIAEKKKEIEQRKKKLPLKELVPKLAKSENSFKKAISQKGLSLIAEIKRASPSTGIIRESLDVKEIAGIYDKNPAVKAISVLTDNRFFGMGPEALQEARALTNKPIVRKEFIIDTYQIYESRFLGADAILLIASLLSEKEIDEFIAIASAYSMDCLVEVHTEDELEKVLKTKADIIGINNRNLDTLKTDTKTFLRLYPKVPKGKLIVAESGYETKEDINQVKGKANAVLMGTTLLRAEDINKKIGEMFF